MGEKKSKKEKKKERSKKKLVQEDDDGDGDGPEGGSTDANEGAVPPEEETEFARLARRLATWDLKDGAAEAVKDVVAACDEVREIDARDDAVVAEVRERGVLDAVFGLLRTKPPPEAPKRTWKRSTTADHSDAESDAESEPGAASDGSDDDEELTPEEEKAREDARRARERFDEIVLPAARAVAHLCGAPGLLRRDTAGAILHLRALWSLLDPNSTPATHEASLRALCSIAQGSVVGAASLATLASGRDASNPKGCEWFVALFTSTDERVSCKAVRLANLLARTPANRAMIFGDAAADEDADDSFLARRVEDRGDGDLLRAAFTRVKHGEDDAMRIMCLRLLGAAALDSGEPLCRILDESDCDGPNVLIELVLRDESTPVRAEAARVLLALLSKDLPTLTRMGERDAVKALRPLLPGMSHAAPEEEEQGSDDDDEDSEEGSDDDDDSHSDAESHSSEVSVGGHNLMTEAFGVAPLDRISPPPPRAPTPPPPDPYEPAASDAGTDDPGFFVLVLKLCALIMEGHPGSRQSIGRECAWVLKFLEKTGRAPEDHEGAGTWVKMCMNTLREPAPPPDPLPEEGDEGSNGENGGDKENTSGGNVKGGEGAGKEEDAEVPGLTEEERAELMAQREAQQARHDEDAMWHNGDTYAAAIAVLKALSSETSVCASLVNAQLHPGGLERLVAVIPTTFSTVEEASVLLLDVCERGTLAHLKMDELRRAGVVEKLKEVALALACTPRPQRKVALLAAEAALLCLPMTELLPPSRPRPPTAPPSPPPNPMPTWRNKMTRNVDTVLPLHTVLPETWKLRDDEGTPLEGDALVEAIGALVTDGITKESLEEAAKAEEAPRCLIAAVKFILTVLGDAAALEGVGEMSDEKLWESVASAKVTTSKGGKGGAGGSVGPAAVFKKAIAPDGDIVKRMTAFVGKEMKDVDAEAVAAAKEGYLSGVYVADAEAEGAAASAMLKWAYAVCHYVEVPAAEVEE